MSLPRPAIVLQPASTTMAVIKTKNRFTEVS
jgi:hypothetical protein